MTLPASAFPLKTSGSKILGSDGSTVRLAGVNWPGAYQDGRVPTGLDKRPASEIISWITDHGFNHVRFPFALGTFVNNDGSPRTGAADPDLLAANPDLAGMSPWDVYQAVADDMMSAGLYVVANKHMSYPGRCCSQADNNGLWYNDNWPSSTFTNTWLQVAARFADNPMIGFDLHNEPRPATIGGALRTPTWGTNGGGSFPTDFRQMYQNTAGRIRAAEDGITHLIFCEGLSYAADHTGWAAHPVTGANIVASVHDYPWYHRHQDGTPQTRTEYYAANDANWGYLVSQGKAPVWVGECGQNTDTDPASFGNGWVPNFLAYMSDLSEAGWCWWSLVATDSLGTEPVTNKVMLRQGAREGYGLMSGQDWRGTQDDVLGFLAPIMP
jgi:endoglucanase